MNINIYAQSYTNAIPIARLKVYLNGEKIDTIPIGGVSRIQLPEKAREGDILEFKLQYFKAAILISGNDANYFVYWDLPANAIKSQLKLMFTNCLRVMAVSEETFRIPEEYFQIEKPLKVKPSSFINVVALLLSLYFIMASIVFTENPETWRNFAMVFGIAGMFRFLSFVFSKEIFRSSGFQSAAFFSLVGSILIFVGASLPASHAISIFVIFAALFAKAFMYYRQATDVAY